VSEQTDSLAASLAPYRESPGIIAALLVSRDGFVVAADAEPGFAADAVAAQVAGAIDMGLRLAGELGQAEARYVSLELDTLNVVMAPFGEELLLVLVGEADTLICEYRLKTAGA
jgi:predicted regulator of Ras-like GTPase activity (Roadblock/LC7/MglB family)